MYMYIQQTTANPVRIHKYTHTHTHHHHVSSLLLSTAELLQIPESNKHKIKNKLHTYLHKRRSFPTNHQTPPDPGIRGMGYNLRQSSKFCSPLTCTRMYCTIQEQVLCTRLWIYRSAEKPIPRNESPARACLVWPD